MNLALSPHLSPAHSTSSERHSTAPREARQVINELIRIFSYLTFPLRLALSSQVYSLEAERAIFRWCGILLDRRVRSFVQLSCCQLIFIFTSSLDRMKEHAAEIVTDEQFETRAERWPKDTPDTKEAYYIRQIFDGLFFPLSSLAHQSNLGDDPDLFPSPAAAETAVRWIPRGDWGCSSDPSGRSVSIHNAAYDASANE